MNILKQVAGIAMMGLSSLGGYNERMYNKHSDDGDHKDRQSKRQRRRNKHKNK